MASVGSSSEVATGQAPAGQPSSDRKTKRRKTSHLKEVPEPIELREKLRSSCRDVTSKLDKSVPLAKDEMERVARAILAEHELSEAYIGWTMVVLASTFWEDQVAGTDPSRRLFLLPHCLKHAEGCPADYDEFGLDCEKCGACSIADFRSVAEEMGYRVLVAEGSPVVLKIIVSGYVDAIVGVACLNVLEKAIDKILLAGIPCMAVPLLSSDCRNTSVDESWVHEMINIRSESPTERTQSYVHLMRTSSGLFDTDELERLAPRLRGNQRLQEKDSMSELDPISATETIAYDFLAKGGKYARPFITLAVHDALTGGAGTNETGAQHLANPELDSVKRAAMSIETFHKASLVHDDIEDDDAYRYGEATVHRRFGTATAINVGDYLIGLGYRLVSRESASLGADTTADILDSLAEAHLKLSEGQGSELAWRESPHKQLKPIDALRIYALKTAPAFEAALFMGARLAGPADQLREPIKTFSRNLGVAFQILNDLKDWDEDGQNKVIAGGDVQGGRPTVLWALALESLSDAEQQELVQLTTNQDVSPTDRLQRVRRIYRQTNVFLKAEKLVEKHRERAERVADEVESDELRRLLYYLVDTILDQRETTEPTVIAATPQDLMASVQPSTPPS